MVFGVFGKGVLGKKQVFSIAFLFAQEVGVNNRVFFFVESFESSKDLELKQINR